MTSWKNIKLIFAREVRDQLRDRRTLFMVAVLPLLLYPALGIGMMQMTLLFTEQSRTVVVLGANELPNEPQLISDDRFVSTWFNLGNQEADSLKVVTDEMVADADSADSQQILLVKEGQQIAELIEQRMELLSSLKELQDHEDQTQQIRLRRKLEAVETALGQAFSNSQMQVLIIVPEHFADDISRFNAELAAGTLTSRADIEAPRPIVARNSADEKSLIAYSRVKDALHAWEKEIVRRRLHQADLPDRLPTPVQPVDIDLAREDQLAAHMWSKLFPALLVIMAVTGAFYPAIDIGAGEKERGTMETLLISPATRTELVLGKFLTVMLFSVSTALLNLASMGMTGKYMVSLGSSGALSAINDVALPPLGSLLWIVILLMPLAALFSALSLALAMFARSSKEGQYYLTPLLMVTLGLTVFCLSPAVEIQPFYSVMPIVGVALLLKAMLLGAAPAATLYLYAIPVLVTSVGYSLLALWWAIELFSREDVLFREAERFDLRLWLRHLLRDKEPTPSFAEAGFCFVMIMLLQFGALKFMGGALRGTLPAEYGTKMLQLLMIQQLVIIASPALFMGVMLTSSVVRTFRLRMPPMSLMVAATLLPFALHPLSVELITNLQWFFPPLPSAVVEQLQTMSNDSLSLGFILMAFACMPAICEEVAFRGFILSGFVRSGRNWLAIGMSAIAFGVMHMIPQQVFNATLLGLVLGLISLRTRSLLPCIVFHLIFNSLQVLRSRIPTDWKPGIVVDLFVANNEGLRYQWPTLIVAAVVAFILIRKFALHGREKGLPVGTSESSGKHSSEMVAADRATVQSF